MENDISVQEEFALTVRTMSSPAANTLEDECAWLCSTLDTLLAIPPRAVMFILKVAVQVPEALIVVVSVIVPAWAILTTTR